MEGEAEAHQRTVSMWRWHFGPAWRTMTRSRAASVIACEGGGAREARSAPGLLEDMR
jgi:hypothetical protein